MDYQPDSPYQMLRNSTFLPMSRNPSISKLPVEIWAKIFYDCLPAADEPVPDEGETGFDEDGSEAESDELSLFIRPSRQTAPLLLTEVSQGWRAMALSTAELWCSLRVDSHDHRVETDDGIKHPSVASKMATWLARSGAERGVCISLRVCRCIDGKDADRFADEALEILLRYMHRWEHVELYWGRDIAPNLTSALPRVMDMYASPVPLLEELVIASFIDVIDTNNQIEDQLSFLLHTAPRLTSFTWFDNMVLRGKFWRPLELNPTWLQELRLGCVVTVDECITMLCSSPQLQACEFTYVVIDSPVTSQRANTGEPIIPTVLYHLLHLKICSLQNLAPLFDSITLPALQSLDVEGIDDDASPPPPRLAELELISLFRRSRCPLEELILDTDMSAAGLLQILRLVDDSLTTLHIAQNAMGCITDAVLISLTRLTSTDGTIHCLCSKLDRICFTGNTSTILSLGVLPGMPESRIVMNSDVYIYIAYRRSHLWLGDVQRLQNLEARHSHVAIRFFE
jgi:hypothetical protein